jgi:hypothetical protein
MQQIISDIKMYLIENYDEKGNLLFLEQLTLKEDFSKKPTLAPIQPKAAIQPKKITPPIEKIEEVEVEEPPPSFIAEKPVVTQAPMDGDIAALYKKINPAAKLFDSPLNDDVAKQIRMASSKRSDLPEIPVLFDHSIQADLDFLTSLAKAINTSFGTSSVVHIHEFEEKNLWKPLLAHASIRLIIIPSSLLKHSPNLHTLCKEYPGRLLKSVEKIPLLALTDISNSPLRKKEIWSTLTRFFKPSST